MTTIPSYVPGAVVLPEVGSVDTKDRRNKYGIVYQKVKKLELTAV